MGLEKVLKNSSPSSNFRAKEKKIPLPPLPNPLPPLNEGLLKISKPIVIIERKDLKITMKSMKNLYNINIYKF